MGGIRSALHHRSQHHIFVDRTAAGKLLAARLESYASRSDVLVLALPRGGVPVAFEVSRALKAPLDVFVIRKLGMPGQEELAMGAIASGGVRVLNYDVVQTFGISSQMIETVASREAEELVRRERLYRGNKPAPEISGRIVILVDDGLATGSSMRAAIAAVAWGSASAASSKSKPVQNAVPAPRRMTRRCFGSAAAVSIGAVNSVII